MAKYVLTTHKIKPIYMTMFHKLFSRFWALALVLPLLLAAASCDEMGLTAFEFSGDPDVEIPAEGGSVTVMFKANVNWSVAVGATWLTVTPTYGIEGDNIVTIAATANNTDEVRTTIVTIMADEVDEYVTVNVSQNFVQTPPPPTPTLTVSTPDLSFDAEGGSQSVTVNSNSDWTIASDSDWITVSAGTVGEGESTIDVTVAPNTGYESRTGTVTFTSSDGQTVTVTVTQPGAERPALVATPTELSFEAEGGTASVSTVANAEWSVSADQDWISVSVESVAAGQGSVEVTVAANESSESRTGTVTFTSSDGQTVTVSVSQTGVEVVTPTIDFSVSSLSFDGEGGSQNITVNTNSEFSVSTDQDWIHVSVTTLPEGETTIEITADPNTTYEERTGTVSFIASDGQVYTVTITQPGAERPAIAVNPTELSFEAAGGTQTLTTTANAEWSVSVDQDWVTLSATSVPEGESTVDVTAAENEVTEERSATITFANGDDKVTVTVKQAAAEEVVPPTPEEPTLEVSPTELSFEAAGGTLTIAATANAEWAVSVDQDWVTLGSTSVPEGESTLEVKAVENKTTEERTATITFTAEDQTVTVSVKQAAAAAPPTPVTPTLTVDPTSLLFEAAGGSLTIATVANAEWAVTVDEDWVTLGADKVASGEGTLTVRAGAYTEYTDREATITFTSGEEKVTVAVVQTAAVPPVEITVDKEEIVIDKEGGTETVNITLSRPANVIISRTNGKIPVTLTLSPGSDNLHYVLTVTSEGNTSGGNWSMEINITADEDTISIPFSQEAIPLEASISKDKVKFSKDGGTDTVTLTMNMPLTFTVQGTPSWVTLDYTMGTPTVDITLTAAKNTTGDPRSGSITIKVRDVSFTVEVSQSGPNLEDPENGDEWQW